MDIKFIAKTVVTVIIFSKLIQFCSNAFYIDDTERVDAVDLIRSNGYPVEVHQVTTEDGYILTMHRIPRKESNKLPVFVMHGLCSSSADSVNLSPNISLGFVLWDAGYDVWLGNARGNDYSYRHIEFDRINTPNKFYNYSFHELGIYDLPASIDYILNVTNQKQVHYVGFSQGGAAFYSGMSSRPDYNKKIRLASLLAPGGFFGKTHAPILRILYRIRNMFRSFFESFGTYNIFFYEQIRRVSGALSSTNYFLFISRAIYNYGLCGFPDDVQIPQDNLQRIFRTFPSDASVKQIVHFLQLVKSGRFCEFDYGPTQNKLTYGTEEPPDYNVTKITVPVAIFYSENDMYNDLSDIKKILNLLPNVVMDYLVPYSKFNHGDFIFAKDVKTFVYDTMINLMNTI